ncbi:hypothetical protein AMECASPLE_030566 [Ameca splendens]|uniref:Ig-like domain-containing protein n=1 Tax=Ameca splendens TaxID=208324 RepID=A0ABV0Z5L6_9TELE
MLKISYNKLKEINRHTLQGLWSLARLHLDHNQLELIHPDAFQGLTSLRFLQLEGNQLQQLHPATFSTFTFMGQFYISTLRHLYLSDNVLTSLPSQLVETMPQLENLYLHENPWTCDCSISWFHDWEQTSPGVLKCKKDRALAGGRLCPMCSSPRHMNTIKLHAAQPLVCSSPVINSLHKTTSPEDSESETLTSEDFRGPIGNISLGLSDEHGNELDLQCSVDKLKELTKISWEQVNKLQLVANITFSVDIWCSVDREKYEQLWKVIAYYSNVPAHLERGVILSKDPYPAYVYKQDSVQDAQYYTGLKVKMLAQPAWLMQTSVELQLNRPQSSTRMVNLILRTNLSETVDTELQQRLRRSWVMIESANRTHKVMVVVLGSPNEMLCNLHSSDQPVVQWMLPDGSKLNSPYSSPENRVSVSRDGRLKMKAVTHTDTGIYYCIASVHEDFAVLSFYLTIQESSRPPPREDISITSMEEFAGNPISLDCSASGSPDAEIHWILPSSRIVNLQATSSKTLVYFNGTLHIPQTQVSDSGYYKCVAINQHGVDTLVKKVSIVRPNGLIRPFRKFPARPQSASGVNTQINVPTDNTEEASGDIDRSTIRHRISGVRQKIPGSLAPERRGVHPSRSTWQRPHVLQIPNGSDTGNQKIFVEKRRMNLSKNKIDPKKWANHLAKIRDRNTVTSLPISFPTKMKTTELTTKSWETPDKSSDGLTVHEREGQHYSMSYSPEQHTQLQINTYSTHGQYNHVTPKSYTEYRTHDAITNSRHITEPHPTEIAYTARHTTHDPWNQMTTLNSRFFFPQTTSVPTHAITVEQPSAHAMNSSSTLSLPEYQSTDRTTNKVQTVDLSEGLQSSKGRNKPSDVSSSINHRKPFFIDSQITPSVNPNHSATSQERNRNYLIETPTLSQFQPDREDKMLGDLHSEVVVTTGFPIATFQFSAKTKKDSTRQPNSRLRQVNSKRRNSVRRGPNRKKQKLNTPSNFITTTTVNTPLPTARTSHSKELNTKGSGVTVLLNTTVPSIESQVASSGKLSQTESTVLRQNHEALKKLSSQPGSSFETKDCHLHMHRPSWQCTLDAPSFPTASPGLAHRYTTPHSILRVSESAFPTGNSDILTSIPQQRFADSPPPPGEHVKNVKNQKSDHQQTFTEEVRNMPWKETGLDPSLHPSHFTFTTSSIEGGNKAVSEENFNEPRMIFEVTTEIPTTSENVNHSSDQNEIINIDSKLKENQKKPLNAGADAPLMNNLKITRVSVTSSLPHVTSSRVASRVSKLRIPFSKPQIKPLPTPTSQYSRITVSTSQDQQIKLITATSEPSRSLNFHPTIVPLNHKLANISPTSQAYTSTQIPTEVPSKPFQQTLSPSTMDMSTKHQLPKHASIQRGKPRITMTHTQTITVKAETDAKLPCEAEGQPVPFLSWTKISNGM